MSIRVVDCFCDTCPIPMLKAIKELRTMKPDDILVLHADRSCVEIGLKDWANKNGYPIETEKVNDGEWKISITKPKGK